MNKIILLGLIGVLWSCSKNESGTSSLAVDQNIPAVQEVTNPVEQGKTLVENADCLTCHQIDVKVIGPSYKEVAAKYENTPDNVAMLAGKIIHGSSGVWGDVPMQPHHGLSEENAKFMAQYILSLK